MSPPRGVGLPEALERAASALPAEADAIRPANGDPTRLLDLLAADAAARVLRWLLDNEPADGADLVREWTDDPERGAQALLRVAEDGLPKTARKTLRRAHHRLRSQGLEVPQAAPEPTLAKLPPVEEALDQAIVAPLDPSGSRAVYLVASHPSGGARLFELLLDESRGVLECRVYSAGRGKIRRFLKEFGQGGPSAALEAPPAAVRALVSRVAARQPVDRPAPRAFTEWRAQVADAPEGERTPGELARAALGDEHDAGALRRAAELVRKGEIGPWPTSTEGLAAVADRLGEVVRGAVIVSGAQRREQVERVLDDALRELFAEPFGEHTAARFEETAFVFWKREGEEHARACLAAACAFRQEDPASNPVARAMLEIVLAPVLQELEGEIQEDESKSRLVQT
jgi:hypothetical protein